jgi:hypothetical protein
MATTTEATIRTLLAANLAATVPLLQSDVRFREHRYDVPFIDWAQQNRECLRVFSILDDINGWQPEVTNTTEEWRVVVFEVLVAYPQTNRYGSGTAGARTRGEVVRSDLHQVESSLGLRGFASYTNAAYLVDQSTPLAAVDGDGVTFLRGSLAYGIYRSMP